MCRFRIWVSFPMVCGGSEISNEGGEGMVLIRYVCFFWGRTDFGTRSNMYIFMVSLSTISSYYLEIPI